MNRAFVGLLVAIAVSLLIGTGFVFGYGRGYSAALNDIIDYVASSRSVAV